MSTSFSQQVGIVSGAASGLGRAIAAKLSEKGVSLALFDKDEKGLAATRAMLEGEVALYPVDIADENSVKEAVEKVTQRWGRIDLLVNSAGITGMTNVKSHEVNTDNLL